MEFNLLNKIFDFTGYTAYDWVAQIIGLLGSIFFVVSIAQKKKMFMIIFQFVALTLLFVNLLMVHAIAGAILDGLGAVRMGFYFLREKHKWAQHWAWVVGFCVLFILAGVFSWITNDGWRAIFPTLSSLIISVGYTFKSHIKVRIAMILTCPLWFVYNVLFLNYAGALNEIVSITFGFIGFFAHDVPVLKERRKARLAANNEEIPE